MSNDAACARCGSRLATGQGYAVYSGAYEGIAADHRVFFTADGGLEKDDIESRLLSTMLYCEECADALFTEEVWRSAKARRVDIPEDQADGTEGRAARFGVIDLSIALRAKRSGRTALQARSDARALGQLWWTSPDETKRNLTTEAKRTEGAGTGKIWVCPTCNQVVTDPEHDPSKRPICPQGHRVYSTGGASTDGSHHLRSVCIALLVGAFCYAASYYVPALIHDVIVGPEGLQAAHPEFSNTVFHILAWSTAIVRLVLVLVVGSVLREGLLYMKRDEPTKSLGLEQMLGIVGALSGFLLTGFVLLPTADVGTTFFAQLYTLVWQIRGFQSWS